MATSRQKTEPRSTPRTIKTAATANIFNPDSVAQLATGTMERANTTMMKNMNDMTGMGKEMFESYVSCCTTWTKGYEEMSKTWMTTCQNMTQQYMQCCKAMLSAKTMKDAMETQSSYMRSQYDTMLTESTKMSEMCVKMATEASEPMQSQWNTMVSQYSKAA